MKTKDVFEAFDNGTCHFPDGAKDAALLPWNNHPKFEGVALKHLLTGADTGGLFSYHLVRIDPGKEIGRHIHDPQLETHEVVEGDGVCVNGGVPIRYEPGVTVVLPAKVEHEVRAGEEGLRLLAKFIPPLC